MPWKYSFGFKLSGDAKDRLQAWLTAKGYTVTGYGWDSFTLTTQINPGDLTIITQVPGSVLSAGAWTP